MEAVISSAMDKLHWSRRKAASIICGGGTLLSLAFATNGGLLLLDLVDYFINNIALLSSCLIELFVVCWVFKKLPELRSFTNGISEIMIGDWWNFCLRYLCIGMLLVIVGSNFVTAITENYGGYATSDILLLGWGLIAAMLVISLIITSRQSATLTAEA